MHYIERVGLDHVKKRVLDDEEKPHERLLSALQGLQGSVGNTPRNRNCAAPSKRCRSEGELLKMSEWETWGLGSKQLPDNTDDICGSTSSLRPEERTWIPPRKQTT
ncbi:MAG: hypothetical protein R3E45_01885 [Rhodocyclaceae bacterium]